MHRKEGGFTLVELLLSFIILGILSMAFFTLLSALLHSALVAKRRAIGVTLATNQMEYLKSLPYDNLATSPGAIVATTTIPQTIYKTVSGDKYTIKTTIDYVDDAYDGCGTYQDLATKEKECRDYPPPAGAPAIDTSPYDSKDVNVTVTDVAGIRVAYTDTDIAARVAETSSNTGAMFVKVVDGSGNPISGATVVVTDTTTSPAVNVTDNTDSNGIVIFYKLPPDTSGYDFLISASAPNYSSLATIAPSGSLQPTYPNQQLIAQNSSYVTMPLKLQGTNSLLIETTDTSGTPLANAKIYVKGGYKKYTLTSDTSYYYDTMSPSDIRPVSDASGFATLTNLVPGDYTFCGDAGATSCSVGGTTYYLAAAVPYGGVNPFNPISVPIYDATQPPTTTYAYNSTNYLQKVRLLLTTSSSFPRVTSMTPYDASLSGGTLANTSFTIVGTNLPCSNTASSCGTHVKFLQGSNTYTASCTGTTGLQIACTVNLTGVTAGATQMVLTQGSFTLTIPTTPLIGGIVVTP